MAFNNFFQDKPTAANLQCVGAVWSQFGNCTLFFPSSVAKEVIECHKVHYGHIVAPDYESIVHSSGPAQQILITGVPTHLSPSGPVYSQKQITDKLIANNEAFQALSLRMQPRWFKRPESITSPVAVVTFLVENPKDFDLPALLKTSFFLFSCQCHLVKFVLRPQKSQCIRCWSWSHAVAKCNCKISTCQHCAAQGHSLLDHRENCIKCSAEANAAPDCPHPPRCCNCLGPHQADSPACPKGNLSSFPRSMVVVEGRERTVTCSRELHSTGRLTLSPHDMRGHANSYSSVFPATAFIDVAYTQLAQEVDENHVDHDDPDAEFGGSEERKKMERQLLLKLDARMCILIVIYILNYIDRNNASSARLRGFEEDLHLHGQQFNTLLSILYVGYIIMQIPSNMFLNYIGKPSLYLPFCMAIWGTLSILTGITTNFTGALLTRFFLGFVEAAFFPGALFLLSKWYKRNELGLRSALLYCGSLISNGFGALIASGILNGMEGKLGHAAWRWLFYIEGALTVFFSILAIFILPDFPSTSPWLSPLERRLAEKRLEEDVGVGDAAETEAAGPGHGVVLAITDWKVWWLSLALSSMVISLSFNAFFPTLSATMGFSDTVTLLLCAPPWVFATICAFLVTRHSDATGERCFHVVGPLCAGITGFIIAISTMNTAARYISLFLMASSYSGFVTFYAWMSNSMPRPPSKRAVALAFINAFSQLGNIAGSYIWPTKWGPSYRSSYCICIATNGLSIVMCLIFRWHLVSLNKKLEKDEEETGQKEKGFRYLA